MILHLVALLSHLMIDRPIIVVGHDLGMLPASRFALYQPKRIHALILLSIAYNPPGLFNIDQTIDAIKQAAGYDALGYWKFLGSDPDAAYLIEKNANGFLDLLFPPVNDAPTLWHALGILILFELQKQYVPQLTIIKMNSTHWIMEEKPREINEAIEQWIMTLI
ncbi:unnamed protein product [Rotaria socialis]|nr:unnamed protein product [Rotaria socialis]